MECRIQQFSRCVIASVPKRITQVMKSDVADKKGVVRINWDSRRKKNGDDRIRDGFSDPKNSL